MARSFGHTTNRGQTQRHWNQIAAEILPGATVAEATTTSLGIEIARYTYANGESAVAANGRVITHYTRNGAAAAAADYHNRTRPALGS